MHNFFTLKFVENKGRVLENPVFLALKRKGDSICYYKTKRGFEVDFLLKRNRNRELIQVCYDLSNVGTFNREKKALLTGIKELEIKTGLILTWDEKRLEKHNNHSLNIMPAWEWLLTE